MHGGDFKAQPLVPPTRARAVQRAAGVFVQDFGAALASGQSRLRKEHFEILLDEENSTGSPPPEKVWDG